MRLLSYRGPLPAVVAARWCIDCRRKPHKRPYKGKDQTMTIDYTVTNIQEIRDLITHHGDLGTTLNELPEGLYQRLPR